MISLPEAILLHAQSLSEGDVLTPREFLHLGSRAAVDQALTRLTKAGELMRASRGTYVRPVNSRFGKRPPSPAKVIETLSIKYGEVIAPHGAAAANALGLTQQVPVREVYVTSGRTRTLTLGRSKILVKHVPNWMLALGTRPAGAAVRALAWLGPRHAQNSLDVLHRNLPEQEWQSLMNARAGLPAWMSRAISEEAVRG